MFSLGFLPSNKATDLKQTMKSTQCYFFFLVFVLQNPFLKWLRSSTLPHSPSYGHQMYFTTGQTTWTLWPEDFQISRPPCLGCLQSQGCAGWAPSWSLICNPQSRWLCKINPLLSYTILMEFGSISTTGAENPKPKIKKPRQSSPSHQLSAPLSDSSSFSHIGKVINKAITAQ